MPGLFHPHLQFLLQRNRMRFRAGKTYGDTSVDFHVQTGLLTYAIVLCASTISKELLDKIHSIRLGRPLDPRRRIIVVIDRFPDDPDEFWSDVTALIVSRRKEISFYVVNERSMIGLIPGAFRRILETDPDLSIGEGLGHRGLSRSSYPLFWTFGLSPTASTARIRARFAAFAVSLGYDFPKHVVADSLVLDVIDEHGFVFTPEITLTVVDAIQAIVPEKQNTLPPISLVGGIPDDLLNRDVGGATIYAFCDRHWWRKVGAQSTSSLFERFLREDARVRLLDRDHSRRVLPWQVTFALIFVFALILIPGFSYLTTHGENFRFLFLPTAICLVAGLLFGILFKVEEGPHPHTVARASSIVLGIALFIGVCVGLLLPFFSVQTFILGCLISIGWFLCDFVAESPLKPMQPFPPDYQSRATGTDLPAIRAAIIRWHRRQNYVIPVFDNLIDVVSVKALTGFTVVMDTLFEQRTVLMEGDNGEEDDPRSLKSYAVNRGLLAAIAYVESVRWAYSFEAPLGFDHFWSRMEFPELSETETCPYCQGTGKAKCYNCGGRGRTVELEKRYDNVHDPDFDRRVDYHEVEVVVVCADCHGSGKVDCTDCDFGRRTQYPILSCERRHIETRRRLDPTTGCSLEALLDQAEGKRLRETPILDGMLNIAKQMGTDVPSEVASLAINAAHEMSAKQSDETHIIRQRLKITEIPITEVDYKYRSRPCRLWIYGNANAVHAKRVQ